MKAVNSYIRKLFVLSLILSFALAGGVPMTVLGAVFQIWPLMGIGIACIVIGFYGTPIAWTSYGGAKGWQRIVSAVVEENLYSVNEIAAQLSISETEARNKLDVCFKKKFLPGFKRSGDGVVLNGNMPAGKKEMFAECPNCGAKFTYTPETPRCPYCNSPVQPK